MDTLAKPRFCGTQDINKVIKCAYITSLHHIFIRNTESWCVLYLLQRLGISNGNNVLCGANKSQTAAVTAHSESVWNSLSASSYHII